MTGTVPQFHWLFGTWTELSSTLKGTDTTLSFCNLYITQHGEFGSTNWLFQEIMRSAFLGICLIWYVISRYVTLTHNELRLHCYQKRVLPVTTWKMTNSLWLWRMTCLSACQCTKHVHELIIIRASQKLTEAELWWEYNAVIKQYCSIDGSKRA